MILPEIAYDATAVRPDWAELPAAVRDAVTGRLGAPVAAAATAGGGFTRAFAAVLTTGTGERVFVKAAPLPDPAADWYAREAAVTAALPAAVPAARPRWTMRAAGWFVLCIDAVDGHMPALPWAPAELDAALDAWAAAAAALARPGPALLAVGVPALPDVLRTEMSYWAAVAAGHAPPPTGVLRPARRLAELVALESALPRLATGDTLLHGDLRVDNVLIDATGRAVLCDWTWPCLGAPWFDTVTLLVSAAGAGADVEPRLAAWHPPPDGVDAALAALAGYWLDRAARGGGPPHSRQHHRFSAAAALGWLAARRGWD